MHTAFNLPLALAIALIVGLLGTWRALTGDTGVEVIDVASWRTEIHISTANANPYVRAAVARSGEIPMLATESIVFRARTDRAGLALRGNCIYRLSGGWIDARWWTLTLTDDKGNLVGEPGGHHALNSQGLVRDSDGSFEIILSRMARPGNWLPSADADRLGLVLRLYDTPLYTNGGLEEIALPTITREICRS